MKKTLTFLPVALCAALALTFSACSSDDGDEGSVAEKYQGEYTDFLEDYVLDAKTLKKGSKTILDNLETKGGKTTTCKSEVEWGYPEWDYLYSDGKKIGVIAWSKMITSSNENGGVYIFATGDKALDFASEASEEEKACGFDFDFSDIDSKTEDLGLFKFD